MGTAQEGKELSAIKLTLALYFLALVVKLIGFFTTGVMVLLADALHSLSDIIIFSFLLAATIWSRKKADEKHMFGHGRAQNAAALVAATLFISFTSFTLFEKAIPQLFQPERASYKSLPLALGVIGFVMLIQAIPMIKLLSQRKRSAASKATFLEALNDQLSTVAALIGTVFIIWGKPIIDPIATLLIASLIAFNGILLFAENFSFLLGRSPGPEFLKNLKKMACSVPGVLDVHDLRAEYVGPEAIHVGMHIKVQQGLSVEEAHCIVEKVRGKMHQSVNMRGSYCYIHVDSPQTEDASEGRENSA